MAWSLWKAVFGVPFSEIKPPKVSELFPGAPKPSFVLLGMIFTLMKKDLQNVYRVEEGRVANWRWRNKDVDVSWSRERDYSGRVEWRGPPSVSVKGESFTLSPDEILEFNKQAKEVMELKTAFDAAKEESDRQQKAVNLIEEIFKQKPKLPLHGEKADEIKASGANDLEDDSPLQVVVSQ